MVSSLSILYVAFFMCRPLCAEEMMLETQEVSSEASLSKDQQNKMVDDVKDKASKPQIKESFSEKASHLPHLIDFSNTKVSPIDLKEKAKSFNQCSFEKTPNQICQDKVNLSQKKKREENRHKNRQSSLDQNNHQRNTQNIIQYYSYDASKVQSPVGGPMQANLEKRFYGDKRKN